MNHQRHTLSAEFLKRILDDLPDAVFVKDMKGRHLYMNKAALRAVGLEAEQAIGKTNFEIQPAELAEQFDRHDELVRRTGEPVEVREEVQGAEGMRFFLVSKAPLSEAGRMVATFGTARDVTDHVELARLRDRLAGEIITAQERERRRLAGELHDGVAQDIVALSYTARAILARLRKTEAPDLLIPQADRLCQSMSSVVEEVRAISYGLHPMALNQYGVQAAISEYVERLRKAHPKVSFVLDLGERFAAATSPEVELAFYRIVQEALSNALRHARPSEIIITLREAADGGYLSVEDDGGGYEPSDSPGGLGLRSMRERMDLLGGRLTIESAGGSTRVCAQLWRGAGSAAGDGADQDR